jgi:hypothetical protein
MGDAGNPPETDRPAFEEREYGREPFSRQPEAPGAQQAQEKQKRQAIADLPFR